LSVRVAATAAAWSAIGGSAATGAGSALDAATATGGGATGCSTTATVLDGAVSAAGRAAPPAGGLVLSICAAGRWGAGAVDAGGTAAGSCGETAATGAAGASGWTAGAVAAAARPNGIGRSSSGSCIVTSTRLMTA
jgi:hypothetical protein